MEVRATSGTGDRELTATQTITVTVMNVDEGQSGTVSIDGTAPMVGDELTASTADVADPDGLPDPFEPTWQWYRTQAGGAEAEISGAASATYTVVEADLDAALTAKASWTDLGGFANTLASAATSAVTAEDSGTLPELSVADGSATEGEDVTFTVTLSAAAAENVTVNWATSAETGDTAIAGTDFTAVPAATLTFMPGDTTATFTVQTTDDTTDERQRDLHGDAVEPVVERDAGGGPDGDGHDRRRRRAERGTHCRGRDGDDGRGHGVRVRSE